MTILSTYNEAKDFFEAKLSEPGFNPFGNNSGFAQLYSNPPVKEIRPLLVGITEWNKEKGLRQATEDGSVFLDTSPIGLCAETYAGVGLYPFFMLQATAAHSLNDCLGYADNVMRMVSGKFVETLFGEVNACVCGSGKKRVFYDTELRTMCFVLPDLIRDLVKSKDIEHVNNIDMVAIRKVSNRYDNDAALDLVCCGELNTMHEKALSTGDVRVYRDFLERCDFYMVERALTWRKNGKSVPTLFELSPKEREDWRVGELQKFVAGKSGNVLNELNAVLPSEPSARVHVSRFQPKL